MKYYEAYKMFFLIKRIPLNNVYNLAIKTNIYQRQVTIDPDNPIILDTDYGFFH